MTLAEKKEAGKNPIVAGICPNAKADLSGMSFQYSKFKSSQNASDNPSAPRAIGLAHQRSPPPHLNLISYPPHLSFSGPFKQTANYIRESSDGRGQYVYVIDTGVDFSHPVSRPDLPS